MKIHFEAKILGKIIALPKSASLKLSSRGLNSVTGTINDFPFKTTLEPDGKGSHILKVDQKIIDSVGASIVSVEITPVEKEPEPVVPSDLKKALASSPKARETWLDITPVARRDWIRWISTAKMEETKARRVKVACSKLSKGDRRPCCFNYCAV